MDKFLFLLLFVVLVATCVCVCFHAVKPSSNYFVVVFLFHFLCDLNNNNEC